MAVVFEVDGTFDATLFLNFLLENFVREQGVPMGLANGRGSWVKNCGCGCG